LWLDDLRWVRGLPALRCLSLRGCTALPPDALAALAATDDTGALSEASDPSDHVEHWRAEGRESATNSRGFGPRGGRRLEDTRGGGRGCRRDRNDQRRNGGSGGGGGGAPPKLVSLDLSRCMSMTDAAGPHLARVSPSLTHLDLSHCPVGNLLLDFLTYKVMHTGCTSPLNPEP